MGRETSEGVEGPQRAERGRGPFGVVLGSQRGNEGLSGVPSHPRSPVGGSRAFRGLRGPQDEGQGPFGGFRL